MNSNVTTDPQLVSLVQRIIAREMAKRECTEDIKEIYQEAKSNGHNVKALRLVVKRQMETSKQTSARIEAEETAAFIEARLGEFSTTGLGAAAIERAA